ncbi:glycerophosphodiester phosphodiesterase family protein [Paenibacillus sp. WQ 127069]|uniref:Glycerophosphodiester phosphodiesterase family protein n=1 Tax=Paenibacillus baimaensis TaxID=2982185 RepID=A0ABT2U9G7_9BACL|nr:glycerophosphodiester phosphodiesterase family protein [Paenibacillus sp. WQ 127069]MCU6791284.1 glycerophosphodiester phosphodiesterase family protein [Paenibacillus sp. WQ 127069]
MKKHAKYVVVIMIISLISGMFQTPMLPSEVHAADAGRKSLDVKKTLTAPVIDGKLDDSVWKIDQPMNARVGEGAFKDSKFGLLWDNKYLYMGIQADDDTLTSGGTGNWFEQDNINVFLDPKLHQSTPYVADDMQLGFVYKPNTTVPEFHYGAAANGQAAKDDKKILRAINKTATVWSLEVALPWDMINFDPVLKKQLGLEIGATDRYDTDPAKNRTSFWSAYNSFSFWNDTSGFGTITLVDSSPISGSPNNVILQENFDSYATGQLPNGWVSDINAGSTPFSVVKDTYGNGRMTFNGNTAGQQSRIMAPVQWDNYVVEADVRFDAWLNTGRWGSIMFRAPSTGKPPYSQMAIKPNGIIEVAYRKPDGNWVSPITITGSALALNKDYTMKVRVFDNHVQDYFKDKSAPAFDLKGDKFLTPDVLPERGAIGFQGDQSIVSFDNLKVTRITADRLDMTMPGTLEALTGPASVTASVYYSDGVTDSPSDGRVKLYSLDESIIRIIDNKIYPIKPGKAMVKAVYYNQEVSKEITVTPSLTGIKATSIKHDDGYILATAGQDVLLNSVIFKAEFNDFSTGTIKGDELTWTPSSPDVVVANGKITAQTKGVYTLNAAASGATANMALVVKNAGDSEYTLYEENFDNAAEGSLPQGWTRKEGTTVGAAVVKSGAFELNASTAPDNPSRVLLPDYLGLFGNYRIEADVTHLTANDAARWHSIMYRIQNNDYPYYQMAVRKDATASNGIEFAERTAANAWNVMETGSNSEAIDAAKLYHYTVKAHGSRVQELINDRVIVDSNAATAYTKGRIGLQSNGSKMKVDNIRITLQQEALPPMPSERFVQVTEPESRISMAPSVITELKTMKDLTALTGPVLPATVMVHVNSDLKVTDPTGQTEVASLDAILDTIGNRMIPAFYVKDEQAVDKLMDALKNKGVEDAFVISDKGDLVKRARTAYPMIRGIVDFSNIKDVTQEGLLDIRRQTTRSLAKIALLPQSAASMDNVAYLQQRLIVVWSKEAAGATGHSLSMHSLITAGVNGIVTDSPNEAFTAFQLYSNNTTLIRKPYIIGHRGMPTSAPENTIESDKLGLDNGADFIENDIYVTKDNRLVIIHDAELSHTTDGAGNVEDFTLEQLKKLNANKPFPTGFPYVQIPTLDEQIELAASRGKMVMAEIKTSTPAAVAAYVKLLKEMKAEGLVDSMSFSSNQLKLLADQMPEMPSGLLVNNISSNETNANKSLRDALRTVQGLNATFNVGYYGIGKNFLEATKHRGLIVSPWTINNQDDLKNLFALGAYGLTTDYALWAADWAASVKPEKDNYVLLKDEGLSLHATVETYKGTKSIVTPEVVLLDGQDFIGVDQGKVTAKKSGTAHVLLRYTAAMDASRKYDLYTKPITIEVKGQEPENPGGNPGENPGGNPGENPGGNPGGNPGENPGGNPGENPGGGNPNPEPVTYTLSVDPKQYTIIVGREQNIDNVTYLSAKDSQIVTPYAAYTPRDNTIVSVENGKMRALLTGSTVIDVVYRNTTASIDVTVVLKPSNSSSGGSSTTPDTSGTGTGTSGTGNNGDGKQSVKLEAVEGKLDAGQLRNAFAAGTRVEVHMTSEKLELSAAGLLDASQINGSTLIITGDSNAAYYLPLSTLNLTGLAQQLGVSVNDLSIQVTIKKLDDSMAAAVAAAVVKAGGQQIATAVDFDVQAVNKSGQSLPISFGSTYVARELKLGKEVDFKKATGVQFIPETKMLRFVPTVFETKDGLTTATLKRNGNSMYTVMENNKSFTDLANHWAKADVELLANKLVVDGVSDSRFEGDRNISRSEFAALLVRALGISPTAAKSDFRDVASDAWYAPEVAAAAKVGLISGYEDGTFRPDREITREEQAAMVIRAMSFVSVDTAISAAQQSETLAPFKDANKIAWAKSEVATAVHAGLMNGMTPDTLDLASYATRAQSAVILKRFLSKVNFIN